MAVYQNELSDKFLKLTVKFFEIEEFEIREQKPKLMRLKLNPYPHKQGF